VEEDRGRHKRRKDMKKKVTVLTLSARLLTLTVMRSASCLLGAARVRKRKEIKKEETLYVASNT
jgi:hypothetical protein